MKTALVPGSFDPITLGHLWVIERAAQAFDKVYVCVMNNELKTYLFDMEERKRLVSRAVSRMENVEADSWEGPLWKYAEAKGVCAIVKGVRDGRDAQYEIEMAEYNRKKYGGAETWLLTAAPELAGVSSTLVRERAKRGESVRGLVDGETEKALERKYKEAAK